MRLYRCAGSSGILPDAEYVAAWRGQPLSGLLFDLDGTLLDTASDIARALNDTLQEFGMAALPVGEVARMIGRGSPMLIERAAALRGRTLSDQDRAVMLERFFRHYGALEESAESHAEAYPGVRDTLREMHEAGMQIAVVTNKHFRFANGLLHRLGLRGWVNVVIGGDTCERRKPDPQPLLYACESLGVSPIQALMVGDSLNDVKAARAANIPIICVPYGYNEGQDPRLLDCDAMIETLAELPGLLRQQP
jgi:phosphoglycolate phosphatase